MIERMEIYETIYEGVVEPLYLKTTIKDDNSYDHSSKMRGLSSSSKSYSEMGSLTDKRKKMRVDRPRHRSKLTCMIHGPGSSS